MFKTRRFQRWLICTLSSITAGALNSGPQTQAILCKANFTAPLDQKVPSLKAKNSTAALEAKEEPHFVKPPFEVERRNLDPRTHNSNILLFFIFPRDYFSGL